MSAEAPPFTAAQIVEVNPHELTFTEERASDVAQLGQYALERQLGHSDTLQLLRGYGLSLINQTTELLNQKRVFRSQEAREIKAGVLEQTEWEKNYPFIPGRINRKIEIAQRQLSRIDFSKRKGFRQARRVWDVGVAKPLREMIDGNHLVRQSLEMYRESRDSLNL